MLNILKFSIDSYTILDTKHYALQPLMFVHPQVTRSAGYTDIIAILTYDYLYLIEDAICKIPWILSRLWQIGHHDGSILSTFSHFMQIDQYLWIAMVKVDTLWEKHWCIAMSIEG